MLLCVRSATMRTAHISRWFVHLHINSTCIALRCDILLAVVELRIRLLMQIFTEHARSPRKVQKCITFLFYCMHVFSGMCWCQGVRAVSMLLNKAHCLEWCSIGTLAIWYSISTLCEGCPNSGTCRLSTRGEAMSTESHTKFHCITSQPSELVHVWNDQRRYISLSSSEQTSWAVCMHMKQTCCGYHVSTCEVFVI